MSISERKLEANRANAQKSRGPQLPEMKEKVSQNARKHGLCSHFHILPCESKAEYDHFLDQLMKDEKPVGSAEIELVVKMAENTWLSKRALRMQHGCYSLEPRTPEQEARGEHPIGISFSLERYIRYQTSFDRAYQRTSKELRERRKERQIEERGFVSKKHAEAEEQRKAEKHKEATAHAKIRRQLDEIRLTEKFAKLFPPNFPIQQALAASNAPDSPVFSDPRAA